MNDWYKQCEAHQLQLFQLALDINVLLANEIKTKRQIGVLLKEARSHIKQDRNFGEWRSQNFGDRLNQQTAYNYMTLAGFPEDTGNIPVSGLYYLGEEKNEDVRDEVFELLKSRNKVSIKDVKYAVADAKSEPRRTRKEAIHENNKQKIDRIFRELADMGEWYVKDLVLQIADKFQSKVIDWLTKDPYQENPPMPPWERKAA